MSTPGPSAPSARLTVVIRIYSRALLTLGSNRRPPEPHSLFGVFF